MCGIVGHLGSRNSVNIVVEGLKRLEYRGYDSAGVSYLDRDHTLKILKKKGKLERLQGALGDLTQFDALSCIGHTRWATHGEVSEANSHPHANGRMALVHNGIVENTSDLREEIRAEGRDFKSETDSEIFLHLLERERERGLGFLESISVSFKKLRGNSAFVVIDGKTGDIFAVKKGAPLVCGTCKTNAEAYISSDPYALVGEASKLYFPGDNVICHLSVKNTDIVNFYNLDCSTSDRYMAKGAGLSVEVYGKGNFEHFMLKEIHEQPSPIRELACYYLEGEGAGFLEEVAKVRPSRIIIAACGTAHYAGMMVANFLEQLNRIPCTVDLASEFRYRHPVVEKGVMGILISQSGETADTLAAFELCREVSMETISIVNVEDSTLHRECPKNLTIRAGTEIGVASTKAFTQQVLAGRLLSFALSGTFLDKGARKGLREKFHILASRVEALLGRSDEIQAIAEAIHNYRGFFFTGRGKYYPVALEGALKLKEIAYVHAEGYASGELKHGPIALIDETMVNIAIVGPELKEKTISNVQEIKARKGVIVLLGPKKDKTTSDLGDYFFPLNFEGLGELSPLYANVANQLLAYYMARFKGTDIDKPRNLAKSVTVE